MKKEIKKKNWFTNKIAVYVLFGIILVLELLNMIHNVVQPHNKIHWMIFFYYLVLILLTVGSFLFYYFKKIGWMRGFTSVIVFLEMIYTIAYSFMSYPKTPADSFAGFVFYIIYGCSFFAIFITILVNNAHISQERDVSAYKAFTIETIIFTVFSFIFFLHFLVQLCSKGYTAAVLADMLSYVSSSLILWYILHIEKISRPLVIDKYYIEHASKTKK